MGQAGAAGSGCGSRTAPLGSGERVSTVIALLGWREMPTDGVDDYCTFLGEALARHGATLEKYRVEWATSGWTRALLRLWRESAEWRGRWVILQFTCLAWSRRALPFGALAAMAIARMRGARTAVFFHEPYGYDGTRWTDRLRTACQQWVIRQLYRRAERAIFADPLHRIPWFPKNETKAVFIPIGASVPEPPDASSVAAARRANGDRTVAVYCVGDPPYLQEELEDISGALRAVCGNGFKIRVVFFGRGTAEAKEEIREAFEALPVQLQNFGLQPAEAVSRHLAESDVMVCVRGKLFPRRSSAIAGITCGVPMVAYAGACEGTHLAEAGVELVPYRDAHSLGLAMKRLLEDDQHWNEFHVRSVLVHQKYLSWDAIAEKFIAALGLAGKQA